MLLRNKLLIFAVCGLIFSYAATSNGQKNEKRRGLFDDWFKPFDFDEPTETTEMPQTDETTESPEPTESPEATTESPDSSTEAPDTTESPTTESPSPDEEKPRGNGSLPDRESCGKTPLGNPYVAGGYTAKPGDYPPYVRVDINIASGTSLCGGTIISDRLVVTAAHCIDKDATYQVVPTIYAKGTNNDESQKDVYAVEKACAHEKFEPEAARATHDIAILRLKDSIKFNDYVQPACLPEEPVGEGKGWFRAVGLGDTSMEESADELQVLPVKWEKCDPVNVHETRICFVSSQDKYRGDTCRGDSGGPIFGMENNRLTLFGATSYGPPLCRAGVMGKSVNADIYNLRPDINDLIEKCE